ncbi:MAG: hypothetical protein AAF585_10625 [Verrucomicrobiota bacterium]
MRIPIILLTLSVVVFLIALVIPNRGNESGITSVARFTNEPLGANVDSKPDFAARLAEPIELTDQQISDFVESRNANAASLIAAWDITGDEKWLRRAAEMHLDSPRVAVAMLLHHGASSENSGQWIDSLIRNDPDNAAGNLFAARAAMASGDHESAIAELTIMETANRTDFYTDSSRSMLLAAYRHAGHRGVAGEFFANMSVKLPSGEMIGLNRDLADAMTVAHLSGSEDEVLQLGEAGMAAASQTVCNDGTGYVLTQLIGISMQRKILHQLNEYDLVPGGPELVLNRLADLDQEVASIEQVSTQGNDLVPSMTEVEFGKYLRRFRAEGELGAMRWLIEQRN